MNAVQTHPKKRKSFLWRALVLVVIVGISTGTWYYYKAEKTKLAETTAAASKYKTTTIRRSDLTLSISGSGTVVTDQSIDLAFSVDGTVATLNAQVGDKVSQGQVLATLGGTEPLKQTILDDQLAVQKAQKALDDLRSGASGTLAQAMADQAAAEKAYEEAKASAHVQGDARCSKSKTQEYYYKYLYAQKDVDTWESYLNDPNTGYGRDFILKNLTPLRQARDQAYANYSYCQGYTEQEINASQAALQLAKAKLDQANTNYETLKASSGVDSVAIAVAQATLNDAKLQLAEAQDALSGATISAPMDGTVMAINGKVGSDVDTSTFITLSNLEQPKVQVNIDETDLENFAVGCAAEVTFDSLPGQTFEGSITQISPTLVTVNSTAMVQGLVDLQKKQTASGKTLPLGMSAAVEVTCKQAKNAIVVPAQALYEPAGQSAYVYVLNAQDQPEKREVEIGLRTVASAEVKSGLSEGEKVITSTVEQ